MENLNGRIDIRLTEVKATYEKLEREKKPLLEERNTLVTRVSTIDRRVNEINTTEFGLNERYNELVGFLPEEEQAKWVQPDAPQKPKETTVKKKKKR